VLLTLVRPKQVQLVQAAHVTHQLSLRLVLIFTILEHETRVVFPERHASVCNLVHGADWIML